MDALLTDLEPEFGEGKIFRPYRDVRFSKDKAPYKTAIAATLDRGGYSRCPQTGSLRAAGSTGPRRTSSSATAPRSPTRGRAPRW